MMQPKRTRFRKLQKGRNRGIATRGNKVSFGEYGLKATSRGRITARQIEAARRAITRHVNVVESYGFVSFQINLLPKNLWKFAKVRGKVMLNTGWR